jgi:hypothetical protein
MTNVKPAGGGGMTATSVRLFPASTGIGTWVACQIWFRT